MNIGIVPRDKLSPGSDGHFHVLTQAWSGMTTGEYKKYKGLTKENLRDNMTNIELALNTLAEVTATEIHVSGGEDCLIEITTFNEKGLPVKYSRSGKWSNGNVDCTFEYSAFDKKGNWLSRIIKIEDSLFVYKKEQSSTTNKQY